MTPSTLTPEQAVRLLERAVAERGKDYVYRAEERKEAEARDGDPAAIACSYAEPDGSPSCMVGLALSYVGANPVIMEDIGGWAMGVLPDLGVALGTARVFQEAQSAQDMGKTWGVALEAARRRALDERA